MAGRYADHNAAYESRATVREVHDMPFSTDKNGAARILGVHPEQVLRLAKQGKIPGCKVGNSWRFSTTRLMLMVQGEER